MNRPLITSLSNPLIKEARSLRQRKARAETGLFVVEGLHHVGEVLEAGWEIDSILYSPDVLTSDFGRDLISRVAPAAQPVSAQVMELLADKDNPQGILAVVHQKQTRLDALGSVRIGAAVVSPQDPATLGRSFARLMPSARMRSSCSITAWILIIRPPSVPAWERFFGSRLFKLRSTNLWIGRGAAVINGSPHRRMQNKTIMT